MSKRCICEICTCGRHRCPHAPTNHLGQGEGPCKLTEYSQVYKPHPLAPRETFKPHQQPMQGGEFMDKTTQRADYHAHPLERPFVHKPDEYVPPQGEFANQTSYKQEYVGKQGAPARAIRNEGQRQIPAKFEGEPTYKTDYRKWDAAGRQQPYGMQAAWEPPHTKFEGQTTFQNDYRRNEIPPRHNYKPNEGARLSDAPFEGRTIHQDAYIQHAIPPRYMKEKEQYRPSGVQFDGTTTFKRDYKGAQGEPTHSFKPEGKAFQSDARFEDGTTQKDDYKKWPMERPYIHPHEQYVKPAGEMEKNTTHNATYRPMPLQRVAAMRPVSAKKASAPFDGTTMYNSDYIKKYGERAQMPRQADYVPNNAPFEGNSTYKGHYKPHALQPNRSFRPDNTAFQSDARFDDHTLYRQDYVPKPIHVCEAAGIDQPTSRFQFASLDSRGHRQYQPVQTSISPLQSRSPMQSQQRLAMSVA
ncbi:stabilizer of axonemal microtubules 2-like [Mercenaria mercenaria]|uniref:stabilizer of axonemal microtubules 2-like n=1 Tax=Mercenaria mercenaria TaxID=6596 RepID=UPI001E1D2549|nr:stabilizer of axonemal microtubules 2-like [Mercenaria mercenaria]